MTTHPHTHGHAYAHPHADTDRQLSEVTRIQRLAMFLEAHFGEVEFHMPEPSEEEPEQGEDSNEASLLVRLDESDARINLVSMVRCVSKYKA